ncbi:MAG: deoxyribose-phosphate aldolase [Planctomycetota bacterium]
MTRFELAKMIDHTALKPETTREQIVQLCEEAREFGFGAVCIAPAWVRDAVEILAGTAAKIATVIGFPHGNTLSVVKAFEANKAIEAGTHELDMVIHVGALKSGEQELVLQDIHSVVEIGQRKPGTVVKVILETALLTDTEKVLGCQLTEKAGADFVKTSTGFASMGATIDDVARLRRVVGDRLGVKAAGGIRDLATARAMIEAGATRLGCSSSVSIMKEFVEE